MSDVFSSLPACSTVKQRNHWKLVCLANVESHNRAVTGSEHAQRDAEEADKINSDSLKDTKPPSPQAPKRGVRGLTASERRALDAEKRAALRQQRMRELEEDAMKAQVVIAQVKAMSASSLETLAINPPDGDRKSSASDNELLDGGLGRRSSGSSTKST